MSLNVGKEVAVLERMTMRELKERYAELFGEEAPTHNRAWLFKRIAWRIQSLAEGDLSERAKQRAAELARDADLRLSPPKVDQPARVAVGPTATGPLAISPNDRLPVPGTIITREYRGETWQVKVLANGFEFEGETYKSLSAVAKKITGQPRPRLAPWAHNLILRLFQNTFSELAGYNPAIGESTPLSQESKVIVDEC